MLTFLTWTQTVFAAAITVIGLFLFLWQRDKLSTKERRISWAGLFIGFATIALSIWCNVLTMQKDHEAEVEELHKEKELLAARSKIELLEARTKNVTPGMVVVGDDSGNVVVKPNGIGFGPNGPTLMAHAFPKEELEQAAKFIRDSKIDEALEIGIKLEAHYPEVPNGYYVTGFCYFRKKEFRRAIDHIERLLNMKSSPQLRCLGCIVRARLHILEKKMDQAKEMIMQANFLQPGNAEVASLMAQIKSGN
jgi:hypothetical protein